MKKNTSIFAVLTACLTFGSAVRADQVPVGPLDGRATVAIVEQECTAPGICDTHAFIQQKMVIGGVTVLRESYCAGFQSLTDANSSPCGASSWLGSCAKTSTPYGSRGKSGTVTGTVYSCTNDHTGNCKSVSGHFDPVGRVIVDSISTTGGCQY